MIKLLIHGGIDGPKNYHYKKEERQGAINSILEKSYKFLKHNSALDAVAYAVQMLEDNPLFNAGTGSVIQQDGRIRMSASIMDGSKLNFAGIVNIENVKNPVAVAKLLLNLPDKVLSGLEASQFAIKNGFAFYNPETADAFQNFIKNKGKKRLGTVGAVALDEKGNLAASTSTGGKGFTLAGRVSDSCTVAGNYANKFVALSSTGVGEDIVNNALCAKIACRVEDGMSLEEAGNLAIKELKKSKSYAGFIGIDSKGLFIAKAVKNYMYFGAK